jgi:isoleucyl-tRNA synthetase
MVDYREEVRIGKEILARWSRPTASCATRSATSLANLYDFDPAADAVPLGGAARGRPLRALALRADGAARPPGLRRYDFPAIFQAVNALATVDLSAFYFDVSKDRLYTFGAGVGGTPLGADGDVPDRRRPRAPDRADPARHGRRAVAAPAGPREESVHLADFPDDLEMLVDEALDTRWARLIRLRDTVNASIETMRQQKIVGTPLEAHVTLAAPGEVR